MKKVTVTSAMGRTATAVRSGLERSMKRVGAETNPDVLLYNSLTEEHLSELSKIYGQQSVAEYIRNMESKRFFG